MRKRFAYAAAVAALLLVGAGCGASQNAAVDLNASNGQEKTDPMEVKADTSIDAAVDGILKDGDEEKETQKDADGDAAEIGSDKAEFNAYSESSYELK